MTLTREEAIAFLTHDPETGEDTGGLRVPCSRWGRNGAECAEVAYDLATIYADASGEPIDTDSLDHCMSLVVNDHDDVGSILYEHGDEDIRERYEEELADYTPRAALSSNHNSVDGQLADVVSALPAEVRAAFDVEYPEWDSLTWEGSWVDAEASGVDVEYTSWAIDWIESHTNVMWDDGEPYAYGTYGAPTESDVDIRLV